MNKRIFISLFGASLALSGVSAQTLMDFEDGTSLLNGGFDSEVENVANPSKCGNESERCCKMTFSQPWGMNGFWCEKSLEKYIIAVDVYSKSEVTVTCYSAVCDVNLEKISRAGVWTTLYFDFRGKGATDAGMVQFGRCGSPTYFDNVRFVESIPAGNYECEAKEAEVDYAFGTVAIGGGGFVSGIIAQGNAKYARTDVGGAYKWNAADCSWKPVTNFLSEDNGGFYGIDGLAIDPTDENKVYMIAGIQYSSNARSAILRSVDGGNKFDIIEVSDLLRVHGNGDGRNCGERIAVDPNNGSVIFCGGRAGTPLIKSTDGGSTWSAVTSFPKVYSKSVRWPSWTDTQLETTEDENGITSVAFGGVMKDKIFVGVSRTNASNVYVSEDGGASWTAVDGLPSNLIPLRIKADADGNMLLSYGDKKAYGTKGAVYRYNVTSKTAENISPETNCPSIGDVAVSASDPKKLVASTNNTWVPQKWDDGSSANGDIFYTSKDGGKTWRKLYDNFTITNNGVTWIKGYAIHWCGSVCLDPNDDNKASFVSGNGIFSCNNIWCEDNPTFYADVNGLEETVALDMVSVPDGDLMSVIGDYTGFVHNNIHEFAPIHDPAPGTTGGINYCSKNPQVMMRVANQGFYITESGHNGWVKTSSNPSYSYSNPYSGQSMASNEGKCAIAQKTDGSYRYFIIPGPGESGIFYSDDKGASWTAIANTSKATHIQVDPENQSYVYAGGVDVFYRSEDFGSSFDSQVLAVNSADYEKNHCRITVVPGVEGLIYAPGRSHGLYVSTDHGKTFSTVASVSACYAVGCGKGENGYNIYMWGRSVEGGVGLYRSDDKGASFLRVNDSKRQFGGPGNGGFVVGDWNVPGRFYMSTSGLGIVYGEPASGVVSSSWSCFVDKNEACNDGTEVETVSGNSSVVAFPNPFAESFCLKGKGSYSVSDINGLSVESGAVNGEVYLGKSWESGVYIITLGGESFKIVKQ